MLTAAAVVATAAIATLAVPASAAPVDVTGGNVVWGVRQSWRTYVVGGIAQGTITPAGGVAQASGNGVFTFPQASGTHDTATGDTDVATEGSIRFLGHGGDLDLTIGDLSVDIGDDGAFLVADVSYETEGGLVEESDFRLVELDLTGITPSVSGNTVTYSAVPTDLVEAAWPVFGNFYTPPGPPTNGIGTAFDPVTFSLDLEDAPEPEPEPAEGSLTWKVSQQAWTSTSLAPSHATGDGAVKDADAGFVFPAASVAFDPETRATTAAFDGYLQVGNVLQGAYRVRIADPVFTIGADSRGSLVGDVEFCAGGSPNTVCNNPPTNWTYVDDVTLGEFDVDGGAVSYADGQVTITVTPDFALQGDSANPTRRQFHPDLVGSVTDAPQWSSGALVPSLTAHFRESANNQPLKAPAPITVSFPFDLPDDRSGTVDITTTVDAGGLTLSVLDDEVVLANPVLNADATWLETSGQLPEVTVTDLRATDPGWNVSSQLTDFGGAAGEFEGSSLGWGPGIVSTNATQASAGAAIVPNTTGIDGGALGRANPGGGRGTTVFDADLDLQIPTDVTPGTYTAVLTLTAI